MKIHSMCDLKLCYLGAFTIMIWLDHTRSRPKSILGLVFIGVVDNGFILILICEEMKIKFERNEAPYGILQHQF